MQKKELLSPNYDFRFLGDEKNTYSFQTINEDTYEVIFKPTPYLFGEDSIYSNYTFEFSILLVNNPSGKNPPRDSKIPPTIAAIFTNFFKNSDETITIYICDSSDGKQLVRQRKFDMWYEYFNVNYFKINAAFKESNGIIYPVSLIIKDKNPYRHQIVNEFFDIIEGYNSNK